MSSYGSFPVDMMEDVEANGGTSVFEGDLVRRSEAYQRSMKKVEVPKDRGSVIPFSTWMGLGKSIEQLYLQSPHYLTNLILKQWDIERLYSEDEYMPLNSVMHPCKAETMVWLVEEVHGRTSSIHSVADLWKSSPIPFIMLPLTRSFRDYELLN